MYEGALRRFLNLVSKRLYPAFRVLNGVRRLFFLCFWGLWFASRMSVAPQLHGFLPYVVFQHMLGQDPHILHAHPAFSAHPASLVLPKLEIFKHTCFM